FQFPLQPFRLLVRRTCVQHWARKCHMDCGYPSGCTSRSAEGARCAGSINRVGCSRGAFSKLSFRSRAPFSFPLSRPLAPLSSASAIASARFPVFLVIFPNLACVMLNWFTADAESAEKNQKQPRITQISRIESLILEIRVIRGFLVPCLLCVANIEFL